MSSYPQPTDVAVLAYAAGLMDGEGSMSIVLVSANGATRKRSHRLMLSMTSVDPEIPIWMVDHFGGFISGHSRRRLVGRARPSTRWGCSSAHAEHVLRALLPYLVLKRERAEVALELRATKLPHAGNHRGRHGDVKFPVTDELFERRESLRLRMLELNKRGQDPVCEEETA